MINKYNIDFTTSMPNLVISFMSLSIRTCTLEEKAVRNSKVSWIDMKTSSTYEAIPSSAKASYK